MTVYLQGNLGSQPRVLEIYRPLPETLADHKNRLQKVKEYEEKGYSNIKFVNQLTP